MRRCSLLPLVTCLLAIGSGAFIPARADITVSFTQGSALQSDPQNTQIVAAFQRAGASWTNTFSNTFTLNLTIEFASLGAGILGGTGSTADFYNYSSFRTNLAANATPSSSDVTALANLPAGPNYGISINHTSDNPNGANSATPYVYNAANTLRINNANAKAVGLLAANNVATDATITFSSGFRSQFDFDRSNGIGASLIDFEGVAAHEIGHALGFVSGVDILDGNAGVTTGAVFSQYVTPLDLFRFSTQSVASNVVDFTADNRSKFFTLNRGTTSVAPMATGQTFGDGQQASHWKDNLNIGIMDPTAANGELLSISGNDRLAFDVMGYNIKSVVIPEASTLMLGLSGAMLGALVVCQRRRNAA